MKVFAISDMHGRLEGLDPKGADLVVVAGDFGIMYGWGERDLNDQVVWANTKLREWCASYPKTQFRFVPGNHDLFAQHQELLADVRWPENAKLLIDAADEVEGLRIYGSPWVPFINSSWAFEEVWQGQLAEKSRQHVEERIAENRNRAVFKKEFKRGVGTYYRFVGLFRLNREESLRLTKSVWDRISSVDRFSV